MIFANTSFSVCMFYHQFVKKSALPFWIHGNMIATGMISCKLIFYLNYVEFDEIYDYYYD